MECSDTPPSDGALGADTTATSLVCLCAPSGASKSLSSVKPPSLPDPGLGAIDARPGGLDARLLFAEASPPDFPPLGLLAFDVRPSQPGSSRAKIRHSRIVNITIDHRWIGNPYRLRLRPFLWDRIAEAIFYGFCKEQVRGAPGRKRNRRVCPGEEDL